MVENSNTKKVKISLMGESGKMGKALLDLIGRDPELAFAPDGGDVVIDFSSPEGTKKALAVGKPLICGTTGLSEKIFEDMERLSEKVPVLYSPNFSIGMNLFFEILAKMGTRLQKFSKLKIEETHHIEKKDAPSGSALQLCDLLGGDPSQIVSKREGAVVGDHRVEFLFDKELLTIEHQAFSREAFAQGALLSAKFLFHKPAGLYSLSDIFD